MVFGESPCCDGCGKKCRKTRLPQSEMHLVGLSTKYLIKRCQSESHCDLKAFGPAVTGR